MVAATNSAVNNVLNNALSAAPPVPAAQNATAVSADSGDANAENDFMQLLSSLMGDDADASSAAPSATATLTDKQKQEDKPANADAQIPPQWLLLPLPSQSAPVTTSTAPTGTDQGDKTIDALTPASNAATNALLAQSLKRFGSDKPDQTIATAGKQPVDHSASALPAKNQDGSSPFDALLLKPDKDVLANPLQNAALLNATTRDKDSSSNNHDAIAPAADSLLSGMGAQVMARSDVTGNAGPAAQYQIHSKVGSHEWVNDVGNRMSMMISSKVQSASLQLTPDNLGPVQVKIDVNNNQASVWFTADHPDTRTALEQSLPRLRELFASQGMSLTDAGVFNQQSQHQQPQFKPETTSYSSGITDMSNEVTTTQQVLRIGLLDTYA